MSVAEIKSAVAAMPERDQAELAAWLLDLLPAPAHGDEDDEGLQEAVRRREELDSGRVAPLLAGDTAEVLTALTRQELSKASVNMWD